ncbi:MAG TPA: efflux RND transporter periplasmic adaptor subunit [Sunxiuqinia sp.]|nr:efflux RND transporter periplasmic adaptor subunit [Sunxiuqinia sp.]
MKTKINLNKKDYRVIGITLVAGLFLGWLFFHSSPNELKTTTSQVTAEKTHEDNISYWTCSMHPQIHMDHPGKCPICGMELIPVMKGNNNSDEAVSPDEIQMTDAAMKIADIQTMSVKKAYPDKEVYLLGKVKPDERNIAELTARFGGRIEKLFVNFTGQKVKKGERLASIYSPALLTAQKELLEAQDYKQSNPEFYKAARNKLKLWDLTDAQIDQIEKSGQPKTYFDILSPIAGTVTKRNVSEGDYVKEGSGLFQVINLSKVWVMFEAYESDLPWIKMGDKVNFTVKSMPGKSFEGKISFIDPTIDPKTRIAQVRLEAQNTKELLKPEMFANGIVTSSIAGNKKDLLIPKTAVLWTGKRAVVYTKVTDREQPTFKYREIVLGPTAGDFYVVSSGLKEGEEIAVNGVFKIDAAAQLAGKPSMMNPEANTTESLTQSKTLSEPTNTPNQFKQQLTAVFDNYLKMKNAFVESDASKVSKEANAVNHAIKNVDMKLLNGNKGMSSWMDQLKTMNSSIQSIAQQTDIEQQRKEFATFNQAFYHSIKAFGLKGETAYYQYCPMANSDKGAYWLSETKEIRNPYFGEDMIGCGETRETLD